MVENDNNYTALVKEIEEAVNKKMSEISSYARHMDPKLVMMEGALVGMQITLKNSLDQMSRIGNRVNEVVSKIKNKQTVCSRDPPLM